MKCGQSLRRWTAVIVAILIVSGMATAQAKVKSASTDTALPLGQTVRGTIPFDGPDVSSTSFRLTIPDDLYSVTIELSDSAVDLDILLYKQGELIEFSELTIFNETLYLSRVTEPALETGQYTVEIAYQLAQPPVVQGRQLAEIPFAVTANGVTLSPSATLAPGDTITGRLTPEQDMLATYRIQVPPGTQALRLDVSDTDADVDLFLSRDALSPYPFDNDHWAQSVRSTETLIVEPTSYPGLRPGTYELMVVDQLSDDLPAEYTLHVSGTASPPPQLMTTPTLPRVDTPLESALLATVELLTVNAGGSGTIVSPQGHIVTGYHVIVDDSGMPSGDITVGFNMNHERPPQHLYRARYLAGDEERDIALLQISAGRYGQTLPGRVTFPFLRLNVAAPPKIGDPLIFLGYPWIGGTGSRVSITYTRGVVAGFQYSPYGTVIKTDGVIHDGNSGGAALNENLELVAIPVAVVGADSAQLAYLYPIDELPTDWLDLISEAGGRVIE